MNVIAAERSALRLRFFFVVMACAVIVTVFAGFAPTFYLRRSSPRLVPCRRCCTSTASCSVPGSAFLVQTLLVARGSRHLHQRLGWIGAAIAGAMFILVTAAMVEQLRRVNGFPPPPLALALSVFDIIVFASLVGAALYYRKRSDWHKRFMLSATIVLLGAPMFRVVVQAIGLGDIAKVSIVSTVLVDASRRRWS